MNDFSQAFLHQRGLMKKKTQKTAVNWRSIAPSFVVWIHPLVWYHPPLPPISVKTRPASDVSKDRATGRESGSVGDRDREGQNQEAGGLQAKRGPQERRSPSKDNTVPPKVAMASLLLDLRGGLASARTIFFLQLRVGALSDASSSLPAFVLPDAHQVPYLIGIVKKITIGNSTNWHTNPYPL